MGLAPTKSFVYETRGCTASMKTHRIGSLVAVFFVVAHCQDRKRTRIPLPSQCPAGMQLVSDGDVVRETGQPAEYVRAFCLDSHVVTRREYRACVRAGGCVPEWDTADWADVTSLERAVVSSKCLHASDSEPVHCVDFNQAHQYCIWNAHPGRTRRLPTTLERRRASHLRSPLWEWSSDWYLQPSAEDGLAAWATPNVTPTERARVHHKITSRLRTHFVGLRCATDVRPQQ
jgi:Sulfatase-modifying factor enzyme 1